MGMIHQLGIHLKEPQCCWPLVLCSINQRATDHGCPKLFCSKLDRGRVLLLGPVTPLVGIGSEGSGLRKSKVGGGTHDNIWHADHGLVSLIDGLSADCCAKKAVIRLCWLLVHRQMSFWSLS